MPNPAQARFDVIFANRSKPSKPKNNGISFAEKELLDYQQQQQQQHTLEAIQDRSSHNQANDGIGTAGIVNRQAKDDNPNRYEVKATESRFQQPDDEHGKIIQKIVYLPKGHRSGGLTVKEGHSGNESDAEPLSSSAACTGRFCVFSLVVKFPYKYMQDPDSRVSRQFFAREKIYERHWNMHYVFGPNDTGAKPLMLVPIDQVKELVQEIRNEFNIPVDVPPYPFQLSFYKDGTPSPQFVGTINSKEDMLNVRAKIPEPPADHDQIDPNADEIYKQNHLLWREKIGEAVGAEKGKSAAAKRKRVQKQALAVTETANQLSRAQRYLGLRSKLETTLAILPGASVVESQSQHLGETNSLVGALDLNQPAAYPFEDQPIMISIDVESYEMDHKIITEIGVSTLDTSDLIDLAPGDQGKQWVKKIRSRHFRIKGRENLRNTQFVDGNPEMFQFGTSEFVAIDEAADAIDSCFEPPYSAGFECEGPPEFDVNGLLIKKPPPKPQTLDHTIYGDTPRNLLLLGHDVNGDIAYLASLRNSIFRAPYSTPAADGPVSRRQRVLSSIRECLDTSLLHKALTKNDQPMSLTKICHQLDITPWFAHNAGNDARYTLEVFIKLAIKARQRYDVENALKAGGNGNNNVELPDQNTGSTIFEKPQRTFLEESSVFNQQSAHAHSSLSWYATDPESKLSETKQETSIVPNYNSDDDYPY